MNDKTLTVTVVGRRCVYINDYRVAGSKPYVSENLPSWSFEADINDLRYAIGRRPSSATKALQARIEALEAENAQMRRQGQDEGFAAAVQELRDMSARKPLPTLWHAASVLADSLEQSRIPCQAV